jgi:hypothetical protein
MHPSIVLAPREVVTLSSEHFVGSGDPGKQYEFKGHSLQLPRVPKYPARHKHDALDGDPRVIVPLCMPHCVGLIEPSSQ